MGHITASNDISASGTVTAGTGSFNHLSGDTNQDTGLQVLGAITASAGISASGTITANAYIGLPSGILSGSAQLPSGILSGSAQLPSGILSGSSQLPAGIISSSQHVFTAITASGAISSSGIINAQQLNLRNQSFADYDGSNLFRMGIGKPIAVINNLTVAADPGAVAGVRLDSAAGHITASGNITASKVDAEHVVIGPSTATQAAIIASIQDKAYSLFVGSGSANTKALVYSDTGHTELTLRSQAGFNSQLAFNEDGSPRYILGSVGMDNSFQIRNSNFMTGGAQLLKISASAEGNYTQISGSLEILDGLAGGHITASGIIRSLEAIQSPQYNSTTSQTGYKLNGVKFLWRDGGADLQVGNDAHKTDIIGTNIDLQSPVTASIISASGNVIANSFVGQRVNIAYASSNLQSSTVDRMFYGGSNGLVSNTWNVGVGETSESYQPIYIPQQYINNLHITPCEVKDVTLKSFNRMNSGTDASIWIYTGSRDNNTNSVITLGWAASQSMTDGPASNGTERFSIDITGSKSFTPNPGDDLIAVFLKNEGAGTAGAWRFNYRLDGITTE